ncbi:MAG TPA: hypothetical protein VF722_08270 [Gemmatimonadaceae bacterium]
MPMLRGVVRPSVFLVAVALLASACGSDNTPTQSNITPQEVQGNWELVSFTQGGNTLVPPAAAGTLTLTLTTYAIDITLPPPVGEEADTGTYTISGTTWSQTSTSAANAGLQSQGTAALSSNQDTLSVNVTTQGQEVATVWARH